MTIAPLVRRVVSLPLLWLLAGFLGTTLIRFAPGFAVDERELDARLTADSVASIRQERAHQTNPVAYYLSFTGGLLSGDLGVSRTLGRPVRELLRDRIPVTARLAGWGLLGAWGVALAAALAPVAWPGYGLRTVTSLAGGLILSIPAAVVALIFLHGNWPREAAAAVVLFPRLHNYCSRTIDHVQALPHVLLARAKGARPVSVLLRHILAPALPQLIALAGVSLSMALGVCIPLEVLCDVPGIGQLAWQSAMGRDLPVLVSLTLLTAAVTMTANLAADLTLFALGKRT
ncbi:MAG: ABC transporter permease [Acidobacteriia bacterium]|nr:ABC transporter permease [Terriglobia bacterium]